ncbi:unnamed protein product, partial [Symbiodinium microadriaticum]
EMILCNAAHAVFSLSKMPSSRQFLVEADADRILLKLSHIDNAKLQTNCSRSRKNLSSDAAETIEVGAVQSLIAMSLEGKSSSKNTEDIEEPEIRKHDDASFGNLRLYEQDEMDSGVDCTPWRMDVPIFKGDSAGRGPAAPEPPNMTTESSVDHPSTIEDLDAGESDVARTKMAFAKMQTPFELRDSYGFDDRDFEVREEENHDDNMSEYEDDGDLTSSISGDGSQNHFDKESVGKESSIGMEDDDSFNAASVYDQEEIIEDKVKPKKKKKPNASKAKQVSSDVVGDVVAELGLY